jgi:hypothetical protein
VRFFEEYVADIEAALNEMIRIMQDGAQQVGRSDSDTTDEMMEGATRTLLADLPAAAVSTAQAGLGLAAVG